MAEKNNKVLIGILVIMLILSKSLGKNTPSSVGRR